MEALTVKLEGDQKGITIRTGEAAEIKPPLVIDISGDINTVKSFVDKRYKGADVLWNTLQGIDMQKAIITFDKAGLSISLDVNPEDFYGPKVKGSLVSSPELEPWKINQDATFNRDQLVKLIRFNKRFFSDAAAHDTLLRAYQNLILTGKTDLKHDSDMRGNKDMQFKKSIDSSSIPTVFYLTMPIFKGLDPVKFAVEVCLDSTESSVIFWFESVELAELKDKTVNEIFESQKAAFTDFVIINK